MDTRDTVEVVEISPEALNVVMNTFKTRLERNMGQVITEDLATGLLVKSVEQIRQQCVIKEDN